MNLVLKKDFTNFYNGAKNGTGKDKKKFWLIISTTITLLVLVVSFLTYTYTTRNFVPEIMLQIVDSNIPNEIREVYDNAITSEKIPSQGENLESWLSKMKCNDNAFYAWPNFTFEPRFINLVLNNSISTLNKQLYIDSEGVYKFQNISDELMGIKLSKVEVDWKDKDKPKSIFINKEQPKIGLNIPKNSYFYINIGNIFQDERNRLCTGKLQDKGADLTKVTNYKSIYFYIKLYGKVLVSDCIFEAKVTNQGPTFELKKKTVVPIIWQ